MMQSSANALNSMPFLVNSPISSSTSEPPRGTPKIVAGKIIRIQPHVYIFVCNHCDAEFRGGAHSFMQHCEAHYANTPIQQLYQSNRMPVEFGVNGILSESSRMSTGLTLNTSSRLPQFPLSPPQSSHGPFEVPSPMYQMDSTAQNLSETVHIQRPTTGVSNEEVYEIYDLGYDETLNNETTPPAVVGSTQKGEKKIRSARKYNCDVCSKEYSRRGVLRRHITTVHGITDETLNESQ